MDRQSTVISNFVNFKLRVVKKLRHNFQINKYEKQLKSTNLGLPVHDFPRDFGEVTLNRVRVPWIFRRFLSTFQINQNRSWTRCSKSWRNIRHSRYWRSWRCDVNTYADNTYRILFFGRPKWLLSVVPPPVGFSKPSMFPFGGMTWIHETATVEKSPITVSAYLQKRQRCW